MPKRSIAATLSVWLGGLALAAAVLGPLLIHLGILAPLQGFYFFALSIPGILLALGFGVTGLFRTRAAAGREGRTRAVAGTAIGAVLAAVLANAISSGGGAPPIHDVTTNIDDPPAFSDAVRTAPDRVNGVDYPDGGESVPEQQRSACPDLGPIEVALAPDAVLARAPEIAENLGWQVERVDPDAGVVEAYDVTAVFQFVDDIVIRVRPAGDGSVVDLRSNSRVGGGDLGANAARIRAFREKLSASVQ